MLPREYSEIACMIINLRKASLTLNQNHPLVKIVQKTPYKSNTIKTGKLSILTIIEDRKAKKSENGKDVYGKIDGNSILHCWILTAWIGAVILSFAVVCLC